VYNRGTQNPHSTNNTPTKQSLLMLINKYKNKCKVWAKQPVLNVNPLTPNDLQRRRAVSPLKIKIPSKKFRQAALRVGI
jgi:hypothetical protein